MKRLWSVGERLRRGQSVSVRPADARVDTSIIDAALELLGPESDIARALASEADREMSTMLSLSALTTRLAVEYLERLARPIPSLTPAAGVQIVTRGYAARIAVESDPTRFGAPADLPRLPSLPPLHHGRPPQDLLTRAVKGTRRVFPAVRAVPEAAWDGFVLLLTARVHDATPEATRDDDADGLLAVEVVDGLARFGYVLRLVDVRYGQEPERRR